MAPTQIAAVRGLLEAMIDPVARAIANAPPDDEPLSSADEDALQQARHWLGQNKGIPHADVLAELGITPAEIDAFREPA